MIIPLVVGGRLTIVLPGPVLALALARGRVAGQGDGERVKQITGYSRSFLERKTAKSR
jgi:hypothetical protein